MAGWNRPYAPRQRGFHGHDARPGIIHPRKNRPLWGRFLWRGTVWRLSPPTIPIKFLNHFRQELHRTQCCILLLPARGRFPQRQVMLQSPRCLFLGQKLHHVPCHRFPRITHCMDSQTQAFPMKACAMESGRFLSRSIEPVTGPYHPPSR